VSETRTLVHLVRHGWVENPRGILYGRLPGFGLSGEGRRQAEALPKFFAGRDVAAMYSSPLQRARETADPLRLAFGWAIEPDERLVESGNVLEGTPAPVVTRTLVKPWKWPLLRNPWRPSWGEPFTEVRDRMMDFVQDKRRLHDGHEVVGVSHESPIWLCRLGFEGWVSPPWRKRLTVERGSVTSFEFNGDSLVRIGYSRPCSDGSAGER